MARCVCCTPDLEKQMIGCVCLTYQFGLFPIKCCDFDNNGMTWGIVCCQWQFDPCWIPRQITHILCFCIPCGCIAEETILTVCCCNPGNETVDQREAKKEAVKQVEKENADKAAAAAKQAAATKGAPVSTVPAKVSNAKAPASYI